MQNKIKEMNAKKSLLVIGAGPTGSLICYNIAKTKSLRSALDIQVWDKARGIGGRFSTSRSTKNPDCYVDLGAQYLTASEAHRSSKTYFECLQKNNLIRPLDTTDIPGFRSDPSKKNFACVHGTSSIVKHFFQEASISKNDIKFNHRVIKIAQVPSGKVEVTAENGAKDTFDVVVSTIPVPQVVQLENFSELVTGNVLRQNLETVKFSTRFALGIFFESNTPTPLKCSSKPLNFVENDPMIRYWSIENLKRNGEHKGPTSVVIHSSVDFGAKNREVDKEVMKPELLENVVRTILPEASGLPNDAVKCHKWKYSQVLQPFPDTPGCVQLATHVFASGDSFAGSGFEGCIDSAEQTIANIKTVFNL